MKKLKIFAITVIITTLIISIGYLSMEVKKSHQDIYKPLIKKIAQKYSIDPNLVIAIIKRESNFTKRIRGKAGEYGLMQITEGAAKDWERVTKNKLIISEDFLFRPEINIDIGTWYISQALKRWSNNPHQKIYALAEYNAGRSNLKKWLKKTPEISGLEAIKIASTKKYILYILGHYQKITKK